MPAPDDDMVFEDAPLPPRRREYDRDDDRGDDRPRKKKKKKPPPRSLGAKLAKPLAGAAVGLVAFVVCGGIANWAVSSVFGGPDLIPPEYWQEQTLSDRFKVSLPGSPTVSNQPITEQFSMKMLMVSPDKGTFYAAAHSVGVLPPERAALPVELLLNDSCDGSRETLKQQDPGVRELSRTSVSFEGYPGKELVLKVPAGNGKVVSRVYLVEGQLFMLSMGGRGVSPDNANVKFLFDSLKSVPEAERPPKPEAKSKPKPKTEVAAAPPPAAPPPPVKPAAKPKPPVDPSLPRLAFEFEVTPPAKPEVTLVYRAAGVAALGFTPDGKALALGTTGGRAAWFDPDNGKVLFDSGLDAGGGGAELKAVVSPQGDRAAFYRHGGQLYYWERGERAEAVLNPGDPSRGLAQWKAAFAPDGATLCTTHGDQVARLWDVAGARERGVVKPFAGQVSAAAYSPDGELLACADSRAGVWDAETLQKLGELEPPGASPFAELVFSPDSATLVGVRDRTLSVWSLARDFEAETVVASVVTVKNIEAVSGVRFSPDGQFALAVTDTGRVRVWDAKTWKRRGDLNFMSRGNATALAFRADDGRLAVAVGGSILLLDLHAQTWK